VRSLPWVRELRERYGKRGLTILGVHTPEFDREKSRRAVADAVRDHGLDVPTLLDNDYAYWKALDNAYWPTFYLVDRRGCVRARHVGETHAGSERARRVEAVIEGLLAEEPPPARP